MNILIQIISAGIASLGFSLVYRLHHNFKYNLIGGLLGSIAWLVYILALRINTNAYFAYFVASLGVAISSEVFARVFKVPATSFLVVAIFPLVPGGKIYQTMLYAIQGQTDLFTSTLLDTFGVSICIALAILISSTFFNIYKALILKKATIN